MAQKNNQFNFSGNILKDYLGIKQGNMINTTDAFQYKDMFAFPEYVQALGEEDIVHFKVEQKPNGSFNLTNKAITEQIRLTPKLTKEGNAKRDRFYQQQNADKSPSVKKQNTLEQHRDEQSKKIIKEEVKLQTGSEPVLSNIPDKETRIDGLPQEELQVVATEKVRQDIETQVEERKELNEEIKQYLATNDSDVYELPDEARRMEATRHLLTTGTHLNGSLTTDLLEEERLLIERIGAPERFTTRYGMEMLGGDFIPTSQKLSLEAATNDPDTFRQDFHSFREKLNVYISNVQNDQQKIKDTIRLLQEAKDEKVSLADILLSNDPDGIYTTQRESNISRAVYANIGYGGSMTKMNQAIAKGIDPVAVTNEALKENTKDINNTLRYQLANILTSTHMNDPLFLQKEDYMVTKNGKDMLLHNLRNLSGNAQNPDGRSYANYHEALAVRRDINRIFSMMDEHLKDVQNQDASYIDEPKKSDGMEEHYRENKRIVDEEERKATSLERTEKVLSQEERKPRSPITGFKSDVDASLSVELDVSKETVDIAKQARLNYETALAEKEQQRLAAMSQAAPTEKKPFVREVVPSYQREVESKQREVDIRKLEMHGILEKETNRNIKKESVRLAMEKAIAFNEEESSLSLKEKGTELRKVVKEAVEDIESRPLEIMSITKKELLADASSEYSRLNTLAAPYIKELEALQKKQDDVTYHPVQKAEELIVAPDPHSLDEVIKNYGWVPEMGESPEYIKSVQDAMTVLKTKENKENISVKTTKVETIPKNIDYRDKWANVIDTQSTVQLKKTSVGYKAIGTSGRDVILRPENILVDNLEFTIDAFMNEEKDTVVKAMEKVDTRKYSVEHMTDGIMHELQTNPKEGGFVEVVFDAKSIDKRSVEELGDYIGEKLLYVDEGLQKEFNVKPGKKNISISKDNLIELVTDRFELAGLPEEEIANRKQLPGYLMKMLQSHARFIAEDPDVVSDAYLAFRNSIDDIAKRGGTIDVTNDTIVRRWQEANFGIGDLTDEQNMEVKIFKNTLEGRSVVERLQDSLFMDVLQRAHNNFFERNGQRSGGNQYDFLINEVARIYGQKFPDSSNMSVDTMIEIINSKELDPTFEKYKHYQGSRKLSRSDLNDSFLEQVHARLNSVEVSPEESLNYMKTTEIDVDKEPKITDGVYADDAIAPADKKIVIEGGIENFDTYDRIKEDTFIDPESQYIKDILMQTDEKADKTISIHGGQGDARYIGTKNIDMLLELEQERGRERLIGTANLGGDIGRTTVEIYKGSGGELLGYAPDLSRTFGIVETANEGLTTMNMDIAAPRIKRDAPHVEMYTQDGRIHYTTPETFGRVTHVEKDPLFWSDMQRSGAYRVGSDPTSASRNLAKFVSGKQQLAYVDIESTGLLGSTIPNKHIQPLEVHAEKIQWDTDSASVMRNEQGDTVIRTRSGNETHRSMTRYVGLTDENLLFMNDVMANENFNFSYNVRELNPETNTYTTARRDYSVLDFIGEEELAKDGRIKHRKIYEEILQQDNFGTILQDVQEKSDKLWYLRNIAKYATLGDEVASHSVEERRMNMHSGNIPLPSIAGTIDQDGMGVDIRTQTAASQENYLLSLTEDAQEAARRLNVASNTKVTPVDKMLKQVSNFLGKTPVVGLNVGNADIKMLLHAGQTVMDGNSSYNKRTLNLTDDMIDTSQRIFVNELDEVRGDLFEELKTYVGQSDNDAVLSFSNEEKGSYGRVEDWLEQINKETEYKQRKGLSNGFRTVGAEHAADVLGRIKQVESIYEDAQKEPIGALTKERMGFLTDEGMNPDAVQDYMTAIKSKQDVTKAMDKIGNREVIDQQYASTYLHPEMPSHTAGAQASHYGIDTGNQHLAVDDVQTGIQVIEAQARELLDDKGFQTYMSQPRKRNYRAGDIVEMTTSVDKNPRGVYQIDTLSPEMGFGLFRRIDDGSNQMMELSSIDPQDFARKMNTHFEWAGLNEKQGKSAIAEFEHDQSRRQIQRTLEHPFKFELSGLQSAGQYRENLGNLVDALDSAIAKNNAYESATTQVPKPGTTDVPTASAGEGVSISDESRTVDASKTPATKIPAAPKPEFTALEKIALQHRDMLSSPQTLDILNETLTPGRAKALDETADLMNSAVGNRSRSFFNDVKRLRDTGVISSSRSAEMVKNWNEEIKAKAMEAGATRRIANNYNLGNLVFATADKDVSIDNVRIDLSSRQATRKSLDDLFNRIQGFSSGDTYEKRVNTSFKEHILPFLNQQGIVDPSSLPLKPTDTVRTAAIAQNIHETIARTNPVLKPFEQFDPLVLKELGEDKAFLSFMDDLQKQMTGEYIDNLSPMQYASWMDIDRQEQELRNLDAYVPNLDIKADADAIRPEVIDTLALGRHGGVIDNATTKELVEYANALHGNAELRERFAFDSRNAIFNALTYRATDGRNISGRIPDIIAEKPYSDQVEAMRALKWVVDNPDTTSAVPYIQNPRLQDYIFGSGAGKDSIYNGRPIAEIDTTTLRGIMDTGVTDYTRNNHRQFFHNIVNDYAAQDYPEFVGGERPPYLRLEEGQNTGTEYKRTAMANENDRLKELASQVPDADIHEGADHSVLTPQNVDDRQYYQEIPQEQRALGGPTPPREDGLIEKWVRNRREDVSNVIEKIDMGPGGGGRWIAGLGVAALALSMFHKAGSPIKLEDRPEGHGVAGTNGSVQDEVQFGDQNQAPKSPKPSTGGTAYVNTGEKGYVVKGSGQANGSINPREMEKQMKNMGGNATIRIKDERSNYDRNWLQGKFDDYMSRGHVE